MSNHFTLEDAISIIEAEQASLKAMLTEHFPDAPALQSVLNDFSLRFISAFQRADLAKFGDV